MFKKLQKLSTTKKFVITAVIIFVCIAIYYFFFLKKKSLFKLAELNGEEEHFFFNTTPSTNSNGKYINFLFSDKDGNEISNFEEFKKKILFLDIRADYCSNATTTKWSPRASSAKHNPKCKFGLCDTSGDFKSDTKECDSSIHFYRNPDVKQNKIYWDNKYTKEKYTLYINGSQTLYKDPPKDFFSNPQTKYIIYSHIYYKKTDGTVVPLTEGYIGKDAFDATTNSNGFVKCVGGCKEYYIHIPISSDMKQDLVVYNTENPAKQIDIDNIDNLLYYKFKILYTNGKKCATSC